MVPRIGESLDQQLNTVTYGGITVEVLGKWGELKMKERTLYQVVCQWVQGHAPCCSGGLSGLCLYQIFT